MNETEIKGLLQFPQMVALKNHGAFLKYKQTFGIRTNLWGSSLKPSHRDKGGRQLARAAVRHGDGVSHTELSCNRALASSWAWTSRRR